MGDRDKKLALAICEYLEGIEETVADQEKVEGLQLARECITDAFDLASAQSLSIKPTKLTSIFDAYLRTQVSAPVATVSAVESGINALDVSDAPKESEDDLKKRAEAHKARGNKEMTVKNYEGAIQAYTDAIAIDGKNPVYYANR
jgi:small glutamine-rich tetratricopeptide repeat-containing protein alpha